MYNIYLGCISNKFITRFWRTECTEWQKAVLFSRERWKMLEQVKRGTDLWIADRWNAIFPHETVPLCVSLHLILSLTLLFPKLTYGPFCISFSSLCFLLHVIICPDSLNQRKGSVLQHIALENGKHVTKVIGGFSRYIPCQQTFTIYYGFELTMHTFRNEKEIQHCMLLSSQVWSEMEGITVRISRWCT
jgi:hypothetical protein